MARKPLWKKGGSPFGCTSCSMLIAHVPGVRPASERAGEARGGALMSGRRRTTRRRRSRQQAGPHLMSAAAGKPRRAPLAREPPQQRTGGKAPLDLQVLQRGVAARGRQAHVDRAGPRVLVHQHARADAALEEEKVPVCAAQAQGWRRRRALLGSATPVVRAAGRTAGPVAAARRTALPPDPAHQLRRVQHRRGRRAGCGAGARHSARTRLVLHFNRLPPVGAAAARGGPEHAPVRAALDPAEDGRVLGVAHELEAVQGREGQLRGRVQHRRGGSRAAAAQL